MIRYIMWQCKHMHTLHFDQNEQGEMYCPTCQSIYQKRKSLSTSAPTKAPVSVFTALSLGLLLLGLVFISVGALVPTVPALLYFGFFDGFVAITFAVLSLRENQ